jgi:hypothetical protein
MTFILHHLLDIAVWLLIISTAGNSVAIYFLLRATHHNTSAINTLINSLPRSRAKR